MIINLTEGICEIVGALIGDGWIESDRNNMYITGNSTEDKDYYTHLASLFFREFGIILNPRNFNYWRTFGIGIYKKSIISYFINLGVPAGKKVRIVRIPPQIMQNITFAKSTLRGVFDTDGCFYLMRDPNKDSKFHTRPRIEIRSISEGLIKDIQEICKIIGIRFSNPSPQKGRTNKNYVYTFEINEIKSIENWFKIIGSSNLKHITKFNIWKKFGLLPPKTTLQERLNILNGSINPQSFYF